MLASMRHRAFSLNCVCHADSSGFIACSPVCSIGVRSACARRQSQIAAQEPFNGKNFENSSGATSMKISCPGCGRTYTIPPDLIARILKEHAAKPHDPQADFFQEVAADAVRPIVPVVHTPAIVPRKPRSKIKIAMLAVTVLWLASGLYGGSVNYLETARRTAEFHPGEPASNPFVIIPFLSLLAILVTSPFWLFAMVVLGVIYFASRR